MAERVRVMVLVGAVVGMVAATVVAGPVNPPAGPIAPTGKTLQEIFDKPAGASDGRVRLAGATSTVTIAQPGNYVLTGDIVVTAGTALSIAASGVTLDLNGFEVRTDGTANGMLACEILASRVTVRNGRLRGGNFTVQFSGNGVTLEDLAVEGARFAGIVCNQAGVRDAVIRRCGVVNVGAGTTGADDSSFLIGIQYSGSTGVVEECAVTRTVFNGTGTPTMEGIGMLFFQGRGNVVRACRVVQDGTVTGTGIELGNPGNGGVFRDNTVSGYSTPYATGGATNGGGNV